MPFGVHLASACRVVEYRRVYHYHVRKTAGTSLNAAFWALGGLTLPSIGLANRFKGNGLTFVRHDPKLIQRGQYLFSNSHAPAYSLSLPEGTFTVTILRDPVRRIISHYRYLSWARQEGRDHSEEPFIDSLRAEIKWLGSSFKDFLDRIPRSHLFRQLYMFSEHYDIDDAAERISHCSAVCFTETYSEDLRRLSAILRLPLEEKHERRFGDATTIPPDDLDRARQILEPEYVLLEKVKRIPNRELLCLATPR
jgi:Sulfotransferase family